MKKIKVEEKGRFPMLLWEPNYGPFQNILSFMHNPFQAIFGLRVVCKDMYLGCEFFWRNQEFYVDGKHINVLKCYPTRNGEFLSKIFKMYYHFNKEVYFTRLKQLIKLNIRGNFMLNLDDILSYHYIGVDNTALMKFVVRKFALSKYDIDIPTFTRVVSLRPNPKIRSIINAFDSIMYEEQLLGICCMVFNSESMDNNKKKERIQIIIDSIKLKHLLTLHNFSFLKDIFFNTQELVNFYLDNVSGSVQSKHKDMLCILKAVAHNPTLVKRYGFVEKMRKAEFYSLLHHCVSFCKCWGVIDYLLATKQCTSSIKIRTLKKVVRSEDDDLYSKFSAAWNIPKIWKSTENDDQWNNYKFLLDHGTDTMLSHYKPSLGLLKSMNLPCHRQFPETHSKFLEWYIKRGCMKRGNDLNIKVGLLVNLGQRGKTDSILKILRNVKLERYDFGNNFLLRYALRKNNKQIKRIVLKHVKI